MHNKQLRGLVGGSEQVIKKGGQLAHERQGEPPFDVIVELSRTARGEWTIVRNTAEAVDCVLKGQSFTVERRRIDANGMLSLEKVQG